MVNINVFSQILALIDRSIFNSLVKKHQSDKHSKGINSWTHLVSMLFCHLSSADSVRDISNGLRSTTGNMSHMGISRTPSKSNLSYMNAHRDHQLFRDLYLRLLDELWRKQTHMRPELRRLKRKVLLMDATVIPLCLSVFDWAKFRRAKGAVKLHTILDYDGCMPSFVHITDGKTHESKVAKAHSFPKGCVVVVDRAYVDFAWKPQTVSALYKERWEIEVFFKHLKQRLKVTSFVGTSENAVYIQIWTALIGILLFKYIQKKAKYKWNLSNLVSFIRLNIFVKIDLWKWANDPFISGKPPDAKGQFALF